VNADQVIDLRKLWASFSYGPLLPAPTILAEHDWLAYVSAMTATVPAGLTLAFPDEREVKWAWPDGAVIVFAEPVEIQHAIVSEERLGVVGVVPVDAHYETQLCRGCVIHPLAMVPTRAPDAVAPTPGDEVAARAIFWIGEDPSDLISGWWMPGSTMQSSKTGEVSHSSRFLLSIITALGHRLTRVGLPVSGRHERRRAARELPDGLRVLFLSSGAAVERAEGTGTVEWSHRWMVRGHWRLQPYGPDHKLRKTIWIDPYVKGPEDKPLDIRLTIWKTT
jgi:hypothetical protein